MISENKDWFIYCGYWGTWSRVLERMGGNFRVQIEVDLTPINPSFGKSSWGRIGEICVRSHQTASSKQDRWTHHLPERVIKDMEQYVSQEQLTFLLHADILPMFDRGDLFARPGNTPLLEIVKPEFKQLCQSLL